MQISCGGIYLGNGGSGLESETRTYWALNPSLTHTQILAINAHILAIKYGAGVVISGLTVNISNAAPYLFFANSSVDLRWTKGFYVNLNDGSKNLKVLISATAPSGEALGSDILSGFDFTSGWGALNSSIVDLNTFSVTTNGEIYKTYAGLVRGGLWKTVLEGTAAAGTPYVRQSSPGSVTMATMGGGAKYSTPAVVSGNQIVAIHLAQTGTNNVDVTALTMQQVTMPAATEVLFSNPVVDDGFNYNATSFTATATRA